MLRPIRTLVLVLVAFVAGILYERGTQREACAAAGGNYAQGLCSKGSQ